MRRTGNVVHFPSENTSGFSLKLFAIIFYLFLAYLLTFGLRLSEDGLGVLVVLGLVYNFFVRQRIQKTAYFKQNMVLLIILLVIFILAFRMAMLLLLVLGVIYWLLVGRTGREAPYFLRFHILTGLILNFFILMPYLLISALLGLVFAVLTLVKLGTVMAPVAVIIQQAFPLLFTGIFWGAALWLSVSALMGRTPYIPLVTNNVRHWA